MRSDTITTIALLAATATAGVVPSIKHDPITKRSEAAWNTKGNIKLTFSKETVQVGSLTPDAIMAAVGPICHESGQCETNPIELSGTLTSSSRVDPIKVTLGPDGSYPTWIRNGLVDLLALAAKEVAKCEEVTYTNRCFGTTAMAYCPQKKSKGINCEVPRFWGINYQALDAPNAAPPNVGVDIAMEKVDQSKLCEDVMGGLGAVAGVVNGYAGGAFTLLAFACV
ncbi:hypothetical protein GGP41_005676 [Bipolaris sorokiniana]|uniref:Uncharacterized protein n=2 Tax=Cochliobolus sativus TaxID=45130 RepID=A0A8H5ZHI0_COCSA|nr:uncharacterized protein COCSADRAFT_200222 [Bipolaris sorokiniana ND90Pr]EMD63686.1 hypothetical protein COCSADRAFT_200222 [Bipolaris sorokiniana ND90Pr]KAF5848329.1 hypothetical protein GGP41_005676 [Bipolaris sorokiniana]